MSFADDIRLVPNSFRLLIHFISIFPMSQKFGILVLNFWWIIVIAWVVCACIMSAIGNNKWMYLSEVILLLGLAYVLFKKKYNYLYEKYLKLEKRE